MRTVEAALWPSGNSPPRTSWAPPAITIAATIAPTAWPNTAGLGVLGTKRRRRPAMTPVAIPLDRPPRPARRSLEPSGSPGA
jgi:hypothetical protein